MATIYIKDKQRIVDGKNGETLLEALRRNGIFLNASCGGNGTCKKCQVRIQKETVLACQKIVDGDIEIDLDGIDWLYQKPISEPPRIQSDGKYGIAVDFGTTTIAAYGVDLKTGVDIGELSVLNWQAAYGSDVISRIQKCQEDMLFKLHSLAIAQLNDIISAFLGTKKADCVVIAGNTVMLHILSNTDPSSMGKAPFSPVFLDRKIFGADFGISSQEVVLLPSVSAFIGSDMVSGMVASKMAEEPGNLLLVDIGTNGEMVLKTKSGWFGCSAAAGPAFEGARIECGMGGVAGAISQVSYQEGKLLLSTVSGEPLGICGSGLVDLVAILLQQGVLDETGRFRFDAKAPLFSNIREDRFYLTDTIYVSQKDIREFQLAKSAIRAAIETLVSVANIKVEDIAKLYLAGSFGFHMNFFNAVCIGLLPDIGIHRLQAIGNSSGLGAKLALLYPHLQNLMKELSKKVQTVTLSNNPLFNQQFMEHIGFKKEN